MRYIADNMETLMRGMDRMSMTVLRTDEYGAEEFCHIAEGEVFVPGKVIRSGDEFLVSGADGHFIVTVQECEAAMPVRQSRFVWVGTSEEGLPIYEEIY